MANELQSLSELFNKRFFRIPDYQRGYSWGTRQLTDFWADLERAGNNRTHYCSQLTLERAPDKDWESWPLDAGFIRAASFKPYFVVDGQQRLTTSIILINALLEGLSEDQFFAGESVAEHRAKFLVKPSASLRHCLFGYANDNPSHEFFRTQVLGVPSNEYSGVRTLYTANLAQALDFFRGKVVSATLTDRERWFATLTHRFLFNLYELSSDIDVFVAFETMNNRGKPLTRLELLKNRLIYLSTLAMGDTEAERDSVRRNVNTVWKTIYEELGRETTGSLDDDDFLRAHWIVYFQDSGDADPLTQFLLNKHFTVERLDKRELTLRHIQDYIDSLQVAARCWHALHFPDKHPELGDAVIASLHRLQRLGYGIFRPLFLATLAQVETSDVRRDILSQAERFQILARSLAGTKSNAGENESQRIARELFTGKIDGAAAAEFLRERVERHFTVAKFQVQIDELFDKGGSGYYQLSGLHYVLFEYEDNLRKEAKATAAKIKWGEFRGSQSTIEHIFPQTPKASDWPAFFSGITEEQRHFLRHSFGNLVALSRSKNASLSNGSFAEKKSGTEKSPGFNEGSFSENRIALSDNWTPFEIRDRGLELLRFIEQRWQVLLGDEPTKLKLLRLDWLPAVNGS